MAKEKKSIENRTICYGVFRPTCIFFCRYRCGFGCGFGGCFLFLLFLFLSTSILNIDQYARSKKRRLDRGAGRGRKNLFLPSSHAASKMDQTRRSFIGKNGKTNCESRSRQSKTTTRSIAKIKTKGRIATRTNERRGRRSKRNSIGRDAMDQSSTVRKSQCFLPLGRARTVVCFLLVSLPNLLIQCDSGLVLPKNVSPPPQTAETEANHLKKSYMKTLRVIHPDKIPSDATVRLQISAKLIFAGLNEAFAYFKSSQ